MNSKKLWKGIRKELRYIRLDLNYHIKRTDVIEKQVNSVWFKACLGLAVLSGAFSAVHSLLSLFS
jgi:hypothetical protein